MLQIEYVDVNQLVEKISVRIEISEMLEKSISQFGFIQPILINMNNEIICGAMRYRIAKKLGLNSIPCIRVDWDEQKQKMFALVDNRVAEQSNWDWCKLDKELRTINSDLKDYDFQVDQFVNLNIDKLFFNSKKMSFEF